MSLLDRLFGNSSDRTLKKIMPIQKQVLDLQSKYEKMSENELRGMTAEFKKRLAGGETLDDILPDAFAACREASWRVLEMRPFPVQMKLVIRSGMIWA